MRGSQWRVKWNDLFFSLPKLLPSPSLLPAIGIVEVVEGVDGNIADTGRKSRVVSQGPQKEIGKVFMESFVELSVNGLVDKGVGRTIGLDQKFVDARIFVADVVADASGVEERRNGGKIIEVPDVESQVKFTLA